MKKTEVESTHFAAVKELGLGVIEPREPYFRGMRMIAYGASVVSAVSVSSVLYSPLLAAPYAGWAAMRIVRIAKQMHFNQTIAQALGVEEAIKLGTKPAWTPDDKRLFRNSLKKAKNLQHYVNQLISKGKTGPFSTMTIAQAVSIRDALEWPIYTLSKTLGHECNLPKTKAYKHFYSRWAEWQPRQQRTYSKQYRTVSGYNQKKENAFTILGIKDNSPKGIQRDAYRNLVKVWHPDA